MLALVPSLGFNRPAFEAAFRDFLDHVTILSKSEGYTRFKLYDLSWAPGHGAQEYGLRQILDALEGGVRYFVFLKARQLGWTTLSLLFDLFWCGMYPGLQGALVTDTDANKEKLRLLIGGDTSARSEGRGILDLLPETHKLPVAKHNRNGIVFRNGSMIDYMVAGLKKGRGTLGRSRALNFCHLTEVATYGDEAGLQSLISTFSHEFPARFYNFESTANGYNHFHQEWEDAKSDDLTKRAVFLGWWRHPAYTIPEGSELFERYGKARLSDDEREMARIVAEQFGYEITREQWAWYRHRKDPQRRGEAEDTDAERSQIIEVEYPTYPDQAFRNTGRPFFIGRQLDIARETAEKKLFKAYFYQFGEEFKDLRRGLIIGRPDRAQLRIWHEPHPNGRYVVSFDPSYGRDKQSDRHCIQVMRCYSDKIVQVAEFCAAGIPPFQAAWVFLELCGMYKNARWILEIGGPGEAIMGEIRHLKTLLDTGRLTPPPGLVEEEENPYLKRRMVSPLRYVSEYLYHRPDALTSGYNAQWKMTGMNKPILMTQLQDHFLMDHLIVLSVPALKEMQTLVRIQNDYSSIEAEGGHHDDRPIALALAVRCWLDWERRDLDGQGRTFERESAQDDAMGDGDGVSMTRYIMMMRQQERQARERQVRQAKRTNWAWGVALIALSGVSLI